MGLNLTKLEFQSIKAQIAFLLPVFACMVLAIACASAQGAIAHSLALPDSVG